MNFDLQKANMWKRISAYLFDVIILGILAVAFALIVSGLVGFDSYSEDLDAAYAKYEAQYGITFDITQEAYDAMAPEQAAAYDAAYDALTADHDALYAYNMLINLTLLITTLGILLAYLATEFVVPLLIGNGQTLGKKIFGVALMRADGVKINTVSLFVRTFLGKFTIETMIPILIILMIFWGTIGIVGPIIIGGIALLQIILLLATHNNSAIHDLLSNTVAVDMSSQMIFDSTEALIAYQKKLHAEKAAKQVY